MPNELKMRNSILVIIVAYNSMKWADKCYHSLHTSSVPCDVLTIDNGSTDGTQDYIRKNFPEVELLETGENIGFGRANNIGLQKALDEGYEYVYLLNQDAWVMQNTFEILISVSKKYDEFGVFSPMQMKADEQHLDHNFALNIPGPQQSPYLLEDMLFNRCNDVYSVGFAQAAHWLITKKCLKIVGGFSPTFPHYGEDTNYLQRVLYHHLKIAMVPLARAVHDRNDPNWGPKKLSYIHYYINPLVELSNPLGKNSIVKVILKALKSRMGIRIKYAYRILKERSSIKENYMRSVSGVGAFLEKT